MCIFGCLQCYILFTNSAKQFVQLFTNFLSKMGKHKKHKKSKKHKSQKHKFSSSDGSSSDEWVEKPSESPANSSKTTPSREEWLTLPTSFATVSNESKKMEREAAKRQTRLDEQYNPKNNVRELNPYWKDGGDGLPSNLPSDNRKFKKPDEGEASKSYKNPSSYKHSSSWRKKSESHHDERDSLRENSNISEARSSRTKNESDSPEKEVKILSDKELNMLAAQIIKEEIKGNDSVAKKLQAELDAARDLKNKNPKSNNAPNEVILTETDSKGYARPVQRQSEYSETKHSRKKQKVETHSQGERVRYFADDDKYSLNQMFENEKFNSIEEQNREFLKMSAKIRHNDDMDEIFEDNIRHKKSDSKNDERTKSRAIGDHLKMNKSLDNCYKCIQSSKMPKHLMVSMGTTFFLSLPFHEPLTEGHCLLVPVRHCLCSTQLDENEWSEFLDFRRSLCNMFAANDEDPIFFETSYNFHQYPHMAIHCVPLPKETGDLAPIYFKKAIDESETEWASNKKLVSLAGRDVRRAVPKGLPYFFVSFGMQEGYAHVIEDENAFPSNFAQEIIGGMLDLHHSKWRKPKKQSFDEQSKRVDEFTKTWSQFDHTHS